jgi:hypothetical protein
MSQVMNTAKAVKPSERCPVLTNIPIRFLAVLTALIAVVAVAAALSMATHETHPVNQATGIVWIDD